MFTISLVLFVVGILYLWIKHVYSYWERIGFPYIEPSIPWGNLKEVCFGRKSVGVELYDHYRSSKEPIEGLYFMFRPALIVRDASLARQMLTKDAASFYDRGFYHNENEPIAANMFMKYGQDWKQLRSKLTPTFTSGKLKGMMPTILQIAEKLKAKVSTVAAENGNDVVDIKELATRFGMDIIGTVGFGLDVNSLDNPNEPFRKIDEQIRNGALFARIRLIGGFFCPRLLDIIRIPQLPPKYAQYMLDLVRDTMEYRKANQVMRKDFIQLLLELTQTGEIAAGESFRVANQSTFHHLSLEECAAQVSLFYLAGFDTTSSTIAYTLFELSRQPDLQRRLQNEVDETLAKYNGAITYESIKEMPFLHACFNESVRKYPTLPFLNRQCTKTYHIEKLNLTIPKGTPIAISLLGFMRDADNFSNPEKYCPDRFLDEIPQYNTDAFLPFGDGPRTCIGMRMGVVVSKIALILLLKQYNFTCVDDKELTIASHALTIAIQGGINVKVSNRK